MRKSVVIPSCFVIVVAFKASLNFHRREKNKSKGVG